MAAYTARGSNVNGYVLSQSRLLLLFEDYVLLTSILVTNNWLVCNGSMIRSGE